MTICNGWAFWLHFVWCVIWHCNSTFELSGIYFGKNRNSFFSLVDHFKKWPWDSQGTNRSARQLVQDYSSTRLHDHDPEIWMVWHKNPKLWCSHTMPTFSLTIVHSWYIGGRPISIRSVSIRSVSILALGQRFDSHSRRSFCCNPLG